MGKIYRYQSLKQKALQSEKKSISYIKSPACDSLRLELYREIGDMYTLSGQADSAFHYYEMAGCRIKQAKILQQNGSNKEAETLLKTELEQTIFSKEKAEVCLALADLQITLGKLDEAEKSLSQVPPSTRICMLPCPASPKAVETACKLISTTKATSITYPSCDRKKNKIKLPNSFVPRNRKNGKNV